MKLIYSFKNFTGIYFQKGGLSESQAQNPMVSFIVIELKDKRQSTKKFFNIANLKILHMKRNLSLSNIIYCILTL